MKISLRIFAITAMLTCASVLSACGGGSEADAGGAAPEPGLSLAAAQCLATAGPFDAAQSAIASGLGSLAGNLPQGSAAAAMLALAVSHLLDSPDALIAALQNLAANHDPQAFASELTGAGDGLRCGLAYTDAALVDLTQQLQNASLAVPALPGVLGQVKGVETLLGQALTGSVNFTDLTGKLSSLQAALTQLNLQLPGGFNGASFTLPISMIGNITSAISLILQSATRLDAASAQGAITGLAISLAGAVHGYSALALPGAVAQPIHSLLLAGNTQFLTQAVPYIGPLFIAVQRVLVAQGNPPAILQQILMGGLSGAPAAGSFGSVLALLAGGGLTGTGAAIPLLSDLLAKLLPRGLLT